MPKDYRKIKLTPNTETHRERRYDATHCSACGKAKKVLWDYLNFMEGHPAFCNLICFRDYDYAGRTRQATSVEEAPEARKPNENKRKPRKRQPPGKTKPTPPKADLPDLHLVAV